MRGILGWIFGILLCLSTNNPQNNGMAVFFYRDEYYFFE